MNARRGLTRVAGFVAWTIALAPIVGLIAAAVLDRGPDGSSRFTVFPLALGMLDPYVWDCLRGSLAMAVLTTAASRVLGVGLARLAVRWRFWGRSVLLALASAGLVSPPAFLALGLSGFVQWGGTRLGVERALWAPWIAWFWVSLAMGIPVVALAAISALERVEPAWEDAARLEGASRSRIWRQLVWPMARHQVARALGLVFGLTLLEPGAPLVLGLRRTIGYQIVEAATDAHVGQFGRAVVLALEAGLIAAFARLLIHWWGGAMNPPRSLPEARVTPDRSAGLLRGLGLAIVLGAVVLLVWYPILGIVFAAFAPAFTPSATARGPITSAWFLDLMRDPLTQGYLINSLAFGCGVVALNLLLARGVVSTLRRHDEDSRLWRIRLLPPLSIGVGVLALPVVLGMAASDWRGPSSGSMVSRGLQGLADLLDGDRTWGLALVMAVGLAHLPIMARSALERVLHARPRLVDAALTLGATRRQARRASEGGWFEIAPAAILLTFALAASQPVPALLFTPTADVRTLGPAVLVLVDEPGHGRNRAAALATIGLTGNLLALALALRGRERAGPG